MRIRKVIQAVQFCIMLTAMLLSCGGGGGGGGGARGGSGLSDENILIADDNKKKWTIMVYMAADNDLESEAMRNLNQLEAVSKIGNGKITVLVLIDRCPGYDSSDGDWTDTRLYEVKADPAGMNTAIVSKRLSCPPLDITESGVKELDMGDYRTLKDYVSYGKEKYPAEKYGVIIWGHGTGWRSSSTRAYAIDDTNNASMPLAQMRLALEGKNLTFIGFDTCFSANLETSYELKGCAKTILGTPGLAPGYGWNYNTFFTSFMESGFTEAELEDRLIASYRTDYASVNGTALSVIDTSKVEGVFNALENLAEELSGIITTQQERNAMLNLCMNMTNGYGSDTYPSDYFLDIYSFAETVKANAGTLTADAGIQGTIETKAEALKTITAQCVRKGWSHDGLQSAVGVHLVPVSALNTPASTHSEAYRKGTSALYKPSFVLDSEWWVPSNPVSQSFLDKLFYTSY